MRMPSYGGKGLKVKTLGDLRKIMSLLEHLEDDYGIEFWEDYFDDGKTVIITDSIDVSYSNRDICIEVEVKEN
jgi:hypothetical protein